MGTISKMKLAVVTGASSGIGLALARQAVGRGYALVICGESAEIEGAAKDLSGSGASVQAVRADLATYAGVEHFCKQVLAHELPVEALMLNAGVGVGGAFLDNDLEEELRMIALNVSSTIHLAKRLVPGMVERKKGHILVTASVASTAPTPYLTVYGATKAFDLSFAEGLRVELAGSGVTVTALQPGATDTRFFSRAHMLDTPVGQGSKDDPDEVARMGFEAMLAGKDSIIAASLKSKAIGIGNELLPESTKAKIQAVANKPKSH